MSARDRMILGGLAVAGLVAAMWFGLVAPKRSDATALDGKISQAEQRRDAAQASLTAGEQARARYRADYATVARLGKAVPADDDVASLVYQMESIAKRHKVDFRSLKLKADATAQAPAPAPAPADGAKGADDKATEPGAATTPAAPAAPAAPVVPGAVVGAAGLTTLPFTFVFEGSFLKMQRFLRSIDGLTSTAEDRISVRGRLLTVNGFKLVAGRDGLPQIKAEVDATSYLVPESQGLLNGATPAGPGTTPQTASGGAPAAPTTTASVGGNG